MDNEVLKTVWEEALTKLKNEYKMADKDRQDDFNSWFDFTYLSSDNDTITVETSNNMTWDMNQKKGYTARLLSILQALSSSTIKLKPAFKANEFNFPPLPTVSNKVNSSNSSPSSLDNKEAEEKERKRRLTKLRQTYSLDPAFNFENFIVTEGSSTDFAYKVAKKVSLSPGVAINPLLLYGGVGLGKTHLMQAIGNAVLEGGGNKKIVYTQSEAFLNEFTASIMARNPNIFKNKYRKLDILLLDDIQFLQGKEGIQQELFYVFEELHKKKAQMVFACDRPLKEIEKMQERLVSRLSSGMSLDLAPPSYEARCAIAYNWLKNRNLSLSNAIVEEIAGNIKTNVRDLQSALLTVTSRQEIIDRPITIKETRDSLKHFYSVEEINNERVGNISVSNILKVLSKAYNVSVEEIKGKRRDSSRVRPRQLAMYLIKTLLTDYTFLDIGRELGGKDHVTIMHGFNKIQDELKVNSDLKEELDRLTEEIRGYIQEGS